MNARSSKMYQRLLVTAIILATLTPTPIVASETVTPVRDHPDQIISLSPGRVQGAVAAPIKADPLVAAAAAAESDPSPDPGDAVAAMAVAATAAFTRSLHLDGSGDYVSVPHNAALNLNGASSFTIEAWVRRSDDTRHEAIIGKDRYSAYWLGFSGGRILFYSGGSGTWQYGNTSVPAGVWTHIAAVWTSGGQRQYYINGQLDYSGSAQTGPAANTYSVFIGSDPQIPSSDYFAGDIAEVRIWNVARSQNEIRRTMHIALEEPLPGLVANWHLVDDYEGNIGGYDGSPHGGAGLDGPQAPPQPAVALIDKNFNTLPAPRSGSSAVYVPDRNRVLFIGGAYTANVYSMDAGSGAPMAMTPLPGALGYASAAFVPTNDTAYVFGGSASAGSHSQSIRALDPDTGYTRTLSAAFSTNLSRSAAVYHAGQNQVYVIGGRSYNPLGGVYDARKSVYAFDPVSETLTLGASSLWLPQDRYSLAAAYSSATDKIYVFGGRDDADVALDTIYEMTVNSDGLSGAVTTMTVKLPQPTYGLSAVKDPRTHLIYLLGGSNVERVLVFDPVTSQLWETQIEIEPRTNAAAIYSPLNRHALLMGGADAAGTSKNNIWRIPLGDGPAVPLGRWDFPSLPIDGNITTIDGDEDRVLIGTDSDGVWRYDEGHNGVHYTPSALGSASGMVHDVDYYHNYDYAWVTTHDSGARLFDASGSSLVPTRTYTSSVLGTNDVFAIDLKPGPASVDGSAFFGTVNQGLKWQYDPGSGWTWKTSFVGKSVTDIAHRTSGELWAIAGGNLNRLIYNQSTGSATETPYPGVCEVASVTDLTFDGEENWWIASAGDDFTTGGVCFIPDATTPGTGAKWSARDPVGRCAQDIDVDSDGRVWVAFDDKDSSSRRNGESGGLATWEVEAASTSRIRKEEYNWENAPVGGNISDTATITPVWESGIVAVGAVDEKVWAGTTYTNLVTLAPRWQYLDESNNLGAKPIRRLWTVRGRLFLAGTNNLYILMPDGKSWDNRSSVPTYSVLGDSLGRIWVGTNNGVRRYTATGWDMLTSTLGTTPTGTINALAQDGNGRIWIGGTNGVTLFDRERFVATFTVRNSPLPTNTITSLLVDNANRLWIGTAAGLARLDSITTPLAIYTTTAGLPGNSIYDLARRGSGSIVVSTNGGMAIYYETDDDFWTPIAEPISTTNTPLSTDELGRVWVGSAVFEADNGWQVYYWTNSGLGYSTVSDNAADGAERVWFSHYPEEGVSVRGPFLPPLGTTAPVVTDISPTEGHSGDSIRINGSGFGKNPSSVSVVIGGASAEVTSVNDDYIVVRLNDNNATGEVSVSVNGRRATVSTIGGSPAFCAIPQVRTLMPPGGLTGASVHLRGSNFDFDAQVFIGSAVTPQPVVVHRGPTHVEMIIQPTDGNGALRVQNRCGDSDTSDAEFRHIFGIYLPIVTR